MAHLVARDLFLESERSFFEVLNGRRIRRRAGQFFAQVGSKDGVFRLEGMDM